MKHIDFYLDIIQKKSSSGTGGGGITPVGTKTITSNGKHDVTQYAEADVQVPTGVDPSYKSKYDMLFSLVSIDDDYTKERIDLNDDNVTTLRKYAFSYCSSLRSVKLDNLLDVPASCFKDCDNLENVDLQMARTIGEFGFNVSSQIKNMNLPNVEIVKEYAFSGIFYVKKLVLPKCKKMQQNILRNSKIEILDVLGGADGQFNIDFSATKLVTFIIRATDDVTPASGNFGTTLQNIYVPDELVEQYKTATNWSAQADKIKPLSEYQEV